ncbi:GNAT family N-acetyltransferase [Amnibacterium endophyticum]|uniref:GNAT family N-acetyltransferase n=1 Tax=Amnibacterium endophyticum TaxID=2109337 RepID=A0ABW4LIC3_9MICO
MTVTISALGEREFFAWYSLLAEYAASNDVTLSDEHVMRVFTAVQAPGSFGLVAHDEGGSVVGLVHVRRVERLLTEEAAYEVEDLFVSQDARRQGVATALIEHVRTRAESDGLGRLRWVAKQDDPAAKALQEKFAASAGGWVLQSLPVA